MKIRSGMKLLFQCDSITDAGRVFDPYGLGEGYVRMIVEQLSVRRPSLELTFLNRGVSADRVRDLRDRWEDDCLRLEPDVVSILVGINDVLAGPFFGEVTSLSDFEADYSGILKLTREKLNAKIVLIEPFLLPVSKDLTSYRSDLDSRIRIIRKLSGEFETELVGLDSIFSEAAKQQEPEYWSVDGVHPTAAGHALIAKSWLDLVE